MARADVPEQPGKHPVCEARARARTMLPFSRPLVTVWSSIPCPCMHMLCQQQHCVLPAMVRRLSGEGRIECLRPERARTMSPFRRPLVTVWSRVPRSANSISSSVSTVASASSRLNISGSRTPLLPLVAPVPVAAADALEACEGGTPGEDRGGIGAERCLAGVPRSPALAPASQEPSSLMCQPSTRTVEVLVLLATVTWGGQAGSRGLGW